MCSVIDRQPMLEAMKMFRLKRSSASLTDLMTFLYVCKDEGRSVKELAYLAGTSVATISRSIEYMVGPAQSGSPAEDASLLRLCSDPADKRRRAVFLTESGRQLRSDIEALFSPPAAAPVDAAM